jgi:hypothetical protein
MNENMTPKQFLTEFVLERINDQPIRQQVLLYRAIAHEAGDEAFAEDCRRSADVLEEALSHHRQLTLKFRARADA